jgi:hypothetical protein
MGTNKIGFKARTKQSTSGTDLASVVRLDLNNIDAFSFCFVGDKALQLVEAPVSYPIIHHLSSSFIPYSFEVFQNNLPTVEMGYDVFADVVINPSHVTSFPSTKLFQQSLSRPCAFSLELSPKKFIPSFGLLHKSAIKEFSLASDSEVVYSEVNTQNNVLRTTVLLNGTYLFRESENEKASVLPVNSENALADFPVEIFFVAGGDVELELLPILEQPQNQDISFEISTAGKVIFDTCLLDDWLSLCLLDHSTSLTYASNSELSRQGLPEMLVNERMELNIIPNLPAPSIIDAELQSLSISFDGSDYFISGVNLDFSTDSRSHIGEYAEQVFKYIGGEAFPHRNKIAVSPSLTTS